MPMEKILICFPFIYAFIIYLLSLRGLFWFVDGIEKILSKNQILRAKLIKKLDNWWEVVIQTPFPVLAKKEAEIVLNKLNSYFEDREKSVAIILNVSLFLTFLSLFLGKVYNNLYFIINDDIAVSKQLVPIYLALLFNFLLVIFFFTALRNHIIRKKIIFNWLIRITYFGFVLDYIRNFINFKFGLFETIIFPLLFLAACEFILWFNNKFSVKRFLLITIIVLLFSIIPNIQYRILGHSISSTQNLLWILNFVFDLATFIFTWKILHKIVNGRSVYNFFWIMLDVLIAITLSIILYVLYPLLSGGEIMSFIKWTLSNKNYSYIFYASTTLIPTVLFFGLIILAYLCKTTEIMLGRVSKYIFYTPKMEEKRTPVYLTLILISYIISIVPAIITFIGAKKTLFP